MATMPARSPFGMFSIAVLWAAALSGLAASVHAADSGLQMLAGAKATERDGCTQIAIDFSQRIAIAEPAPASVGDELHVKLTAEGPHSAAREALHPPVSEQASIHAIELEHSGGNSVLAVYFRHAVSYQLALGTNGQSLVLAVAAPETAGTCAPDVSVADAGLLNRAAPSNVTGDTQIAALRAAIAKPDYDAAIAAATQLVQGPDRRHHQEAQELLGIALDGKGLKAQAKAEYQDFLRLYPEGEGNERVTKRLALIELPAVAAEGSLKTTSAQPASGILEPKHSDVLDGKEGGAASIRRFGTFDRSGSSAISEPGRPDMLREDWIVGYTGSLSTYYERNQGGRDYFIPLPLRAGWDLDPHNQLYAEDLVSAFDFQTRFARNGFIGKIRFSGSQDHGFLENSDRYYASALYFDADWRDQGITARIGRQSRYSGGILGRFDGVSASAQVSPAIRISLAAGSPVVRSYDAPFDDDRYFYGIGVNYTPWGKGKDIGVFFIEQRSGGLLDRQGIGAELRYSDEFRSAFATTDFDIHYRELNSLLLSGTQSFSDQSSVFVNLDYRRAPLVFTTNAMQGQSTLSLAQLLTKYRLDDIERFAIDRTAQSYEADVGYILPLSETLMVSLDGTLTYLSETQGSAGVEPSPSSGVEFYGSAQLTATSVITPGDAVFGTIRYADLQAGQYYMLEAGTRYPVSESLRISPLMRVGYVDYGNGNDHEFQFMPALRASYAVSKDLIFELEAGKKWIVRETGHGRENEDELLILGGIRYEFSGGAW